MFYILPSVQKHAYYMNYNIQKKLFLMLFHLPIEGYQYLYFYYFPSTISSAPVPLEQSGISQNKKEEIFAKQDPNKMKQILLSKEDLQNEGYESKKRPWTAQEDKKLLKLCKDQNARFQEIATNMEGRNAKMCYSRYRRLSYQTRLSWTSQQEERLLQLIDDIGQEWRQLSNHFPGRTHKQLKDHYQNYLRDHVNRSEWTLEQDMKLINLINQYGKDWAIIAQELPGRSKNQIKNRFFGKITRMNNKKLAISFGS